MFNQIQLLSPTPNIILAGNFSVPGSALVIGSKSSLPTDASPQILDKKIVYPNPSSREFGIRVTGRFTYRIANELGQEFEKGLGQNQANVGARLASGIYFITIIQNGKADT